VPSAHGTAGLADADLDDLLGVVSVTEDLQAFCGTGDAPGDC
jgi:hypothetical protein